MEGSPTKVRLARISLQISACIPTGEERALDNNAMGVISQEILAELAATLPEGAVLFGLKMWVDEREGDFAEIEETKELHARAVLKEEK